MTRTFFVACVLLSTCTFQMLAAEADQECTIHTVGELLDQTQTGLGNVFWGGAGIVVGLFAAEKFNTRLMISVAVPALKQASDYLVAQNLRSQLSGLPVNKRVKVCRPVNGNSLLPGWVTATLGFKDVILVTELNVDVPRLQKEPPPVSFGTGSLQGGFDSQFLRELSRQGTAFKLREDAIPATQPTAPSGGPNHLDMSPLQTPLLQNRNTLMDQFLHPYTASSPALTTVRGQVFDGGSGQPLPDVTVQLAPVNQPATWSGVTTSIYGGFSFTIPASGTYQLSAFAPGFYGSNLYIDGSAPIANGYRIEMQRQSPYPCTFSARNQTPWVVDWRVKSPKWQQMDSFRTIKIEIREPGDFQAMATFKDAPPVYWSPVPADCDGPGYTTLLPPQSYTGPR